MIIKKGASSIHAQHPSLATKTRVAKSLYTRVQLIRYSLSALVLSLSLSFSLKDLGDEIFFPTDRSGQQTLQNYVKTMTLDLSMAFFLFYIDKTKKKTKLWRVISFCFLANSFYRSIRCWKKKKRSPKRPCTSLKRRTVVLKKVSCYTSCCISEKAQFLSSSLKLFFSL